MITAVDSNIIIDILEPDAMFGKSSMLALLYARLQGPVVACDVAWTEMATGYDDLVKFRLNMDFLHVDFSPLSEEAAFKASAQWQKYRQVKRYFGERRRVVADFLIGGHALVQCDRLLTRDSGFFRNYFGGLDVITPEQGH